MFSVFGEKQNPVDQALKIIEKEQKKLNKINEKISKNKINGSPKHVMLVASNYNRK